VALFDAIHSVDRPSLAERWPRNAPGRAPADAVRGGQYRRRAQRRASCRKTPTHSSRPAGRATGSISPG
jgi:hypothetical protein